MSQVGPELMVLMKMGSKSIAVIRLPGNGMISQQAKKTNSFVQFILKVSFFISLEIYRSCYYLAILETEKYNLPSNYVYASNPWGDSFYKIYGEMNYTAAESQCKSDGALLAVPRFESENNFIADLNTAKFWIGVNDLQEEGKFVTVEGDLSYTNWYNGQPNNSLHSNGYDEDGVTMNWASKRYWNDSPINQLNPFVCLYRTIESGENRTIVFENELKMYWGFQGEKSRVKNRFEKIIFRGMFL